MTIATNYETTVEKGNSGWVATSIAPIGRTEEADLKIELHTSRSGRNLRTGATGVQHLADGFKRYRIGKDFCAPRVAVSPCARVTERAVQQQHDAAIAAHLDALVEQAKEYYADELV